MAFTAPRSFVNPPAFMHLKLLEDHGNTHIICYIDSAGVLWGTRPLVPGGYTPVLTKSLDAGDTWVDVKDFTGAYQDIPSVLVTEYGTILCIVNTSDHKTCMVRSADGGTTWSVVQSFTYRTNALNSLIDAGPLGLFWGQYPSEGAGIGIGAGDTLSVFNSTDDGETWAGLKAWDYYWSGVGDDSGDHIRHIHHMTYDSYGGAVLIATGDANSQCRLYRYDGSEFALLGGGTQDWRFVGSCVFQDYIMLPTDAGEVNKVFRLRRSDDAVDYIEDRMDNLSWFSTAISGKNIGIIGTQPWGQENGVNNHVVLYTVDSRNIVEVARFQGIVGAHANVWRIFPDPKRGYVHLNLRGIAPDSAKRYVRFRVTSPFPWV